MCAVCRREDKGFLPPKITVQEQTGQGRGEGPQRVKRLENGLGQSLATKNLSSLCISFKLHCKEDLTQDSATLTGWHRTKRSGEGNMLVFYIPPCRNFPEIYPV